MELRQQSSTIATSEANIIPCVNPLSKPASPPLLSSVPRNHDRNTVLGVDFDIELGNTADEAKDDPGKHDTFDGDNQQQPAELKR